MSRLVPLAEAAARLGIRPRWLRQLCADGRVPGAERTGEGNRATWRVPVRRGRVDVTEVQRGRPKLEAIDKHDREAIDREEAYEAGSPS